MSFVFYSEKINKTVSNNFLAAVTLTVVSVLVIVGGLSAFKSADKIHYNSVSNCFIIDPGHGGEDGGAIAPDGTQEKDLNLQIALKLNDILTSLGLNTVMTRSTDTAINDSDASSLKEIKVSDMHNRLDICNSSDNNILVSIHQNKFEQSKYSGAQIFYSQNTSESKRLAQCIQESVVSLIQPENTREIKPADKNIYLLYNANVPAVICECGFISNDRELNNLKNEEYQTKIALAIAKGIFEYCENSDL